MIRSTLRFAALTFAIVCGFSCLHAQSPIASLRPIAQSNRVAANADLGPQTQLTGHIPNWVSHGTPVAQSADLSADMRLTIVLQRDPAVQAAFTQFLQDQQTPGNALYHQWLTPQQVGTLFGPTADDLAAVSNWLTAQGLTIINVEPSGVMINMHGTTSAIANAFRTSFAYFPLNGESRISAVNEPSVPTALSPVINVIFGLTDLPLNPTYYRTAPNQMPSATGSGASPKPLYTQSVGNNYVTPGDFAIIYDVNSVYTGGNKGATIGSKTNHVAIIGRSRVAATDISEFATNTGIGSAYTLNTITGIGTLVDPGPVCTYAQAEANSCSTSGDQGEQTLDVDRVVGNAPAVTADLIVSSTASGGILTAAQYNVSTQLDPVMTISYGACEVSAGQSNDTTFDTLYSSGAAEGISTFVSSGDSAVNGCATAFSAVTTTYTASINYLCASTYATCVGGTEFADASSYATYWNTTNATGLISAKSYIPEGAWNEPGTSSPYVTAGTGGGPSLYISKPSYQTGTGVPADGKRDTPDVAYPAAQHDSYYACLDYALGSYNGQGSPPITSADNCTTAGGGYFFGFSGTSAAAPAMAGVTALLNTKLGASQGNLNPLLYTLAATTSNNVFHDITVTSSGVSGCSVTVPSMCNNSTPGSTALSTTATGGQQGYLVQTGFDLATGWGSIDVANFLTAAAAAAKVSTTLAVTATSNTIAAGGSDTFTATLHGTSTPPGAATGTVQFYNGGVAFGSAVTISSNVATSAATTFSTAGTDSITAIYSGDTNYATSTSPAYTLTVTAAPTFSVTPTTTTYNLISGVTTGNTDVITFASLNTFAGTVNYTCSATNSSGTAAGTCALLPTSGTLTSGGNTTSTLTITTTPGTSGVLNVTVTGTSGSTVVTSSAIAVTLTASSYTMAAVPLTLNLTSGATTGNTSVVTLTSVNGFAGSVAITCTATKTSGNAAGSCAGTTPVTLTAGGTATSTVTLTSTAGTAGVLSLAVSGSGAPTGGTIAATASIPTPITATLVTPSFTMSAPATISLAGNATTGNTVTVTLTSTNGYVGTATVTCASSVTTLANCSGGAATLTSGGTATVTVTVAPVLHSFGAATLTVSGSGTPTGGVLFTATPVTVAATVTTVNSTTTVVAAPTTVVAGSPTTLTATVSGVSLNGNPTGTVTFLAGGTAITGGTGTLSTTGSVTTATYTYTPSASSASATAVAITASYAGDSGYAASTSAATNLTVSGTTAAATSVPPSFTSGATTGNTATITFTSVGGYAGAVSASCTITATSGSPANPATCAASAPANVTAGGTTTTTVTITSTTAHAQQSGPFQAGLTGWGLRGGAVLAVLICLVPFRRRRFIRSLAAFVLLACGLIAISGCSGGAAAPVKQSSAGTYTVNTTGTSGTATASVSFTLTIN
jgi:hypothetical protein